MYPVSDLLLMTCMTGPEGGVQTAPFTRNGLSGRACGGHVPPEKDSPENALGVRILCR